MAKEMTIEEFRDEVIKRGIASVNQYETDASIIEAALEGFEICKTIELNPETWMAKITVRQRYERHLRDFSGSPQQHHQHTIDQYWRNRYITLQIEHVFERLKVAWAMEPLSARAMIDYANIVGVKEA